jgi:hypothetical protein
MQTVVTRGPKWAQIPFYSLDDIEPWWPHTQSLLEEALAVRELNENRFLLDIGNTGGESSIRLDFQFVGQHTPFLEEYQWRFQEKYEGLGKIETHYFYIDANADYEWHRDNVLPTATSEVGKRMPVNCCLNVIITDDGSECEFLNHGLFKYKAGVLNTSVLHRVKPSSLRILARISFLDAVYEEVVHKIRKVHK